MEEKLIHYFKTYKDNDVVFATSNGFLFHRMTDAQAHASTLADTKVKSYDRVEYSEPKGEGKEAADEKKAADKKAADKKAADEKKIADKQAADEKKAADKVAKDAKKAADKEAAEGK